MVRFCIERYSTDLQHIRVCVEDALQWTVDYVGSLKGLEDVDQDQIGDNSLGLCNRCNITSYPVLDERNLCHKCWTGGPRGKLYISLKYKGIYMSVVSVFH